MNKLKTFFLISVLILSSLVVSAQCEVNISVFPENIVCGDYAELTAFGQGQGTLIFEENFDSGIPSGWTFTQQASFNNPCSPNGVDGTVHIWMGNASPVPRLLESLPLDLTGASAGVTVCFDLLFAIQGNNTPCEGPDEPEEGVYLQYSIDNGLTWITIHYFDPLGGIEPQLTNWNNWCFLIPQNGITNQTRIRWFQDNDSGADYDHWGLDNINLFFNDTTYQITSLTDSFSFGNGGTHTVSPHLTTSYIIEMANPGGSSCRDTVEVVVENPSILIDAGKDTSACSGGCVSLDASARVIKREAKNSTYANNEVTALNFSTGSNTSSININITDLNMNTILPGSITSVCISNLNFFGFNIGPPPQIVSIGELNIYLVCPDGTRLLLIPSGVTTSPSPLDGYTNTCFTPMSTIQIGSTSSPYTDAFIPAEPFNNLAGCTANGLWSMVIEPDSGINLSVGSGTFSGWSITFDDPELSYEADYYWSPTSFMTDSSLNAVVCPTSDQTYTLTAMDTAGCITASDEVYVAAGLLLNVQTTLANTGDNGTATAIISGGTPPFIYQWSNGESTTSIDSLVPGNYAVTVTDSTGCSGTANFDIDMFSGIPSQKPETILIYPNPSNNKFTITTNAKEVLGKVEITVLNSVSVSFYTEQFNFINQDHTLDLSHFASGTYFLQIKSQQHLWVNKIVLLK